MAAPQVARAVLATLFAITGLVSLIVYSEGPGRQCAIGAALLACFSQFAGQSPGRLAAGVANGAAYVGFALALVALAKL